MDRRRITLVTILVLMSTMLLPQVAPEAHAASGPGSGPTATPVPTAAPEEKEPSVSALKVGVGVGLGHKYPTADSQVAAVVDSVLSDGAEAAFRVARAKNLTVVGTGVRVIAEASDLARAERSVTASGAKIEATAGDLIQVLATPSALVGLLRAPGIGYVRAPLPHIADTVTDEGVGSTNASGLQAVGDTGTGVKIAVIDLGFSGLSAAQADGDIPASVTTVDYCSGGFSTVTDHGTAVAEVIHKMAPGAALYLICVDTEVALAQAEVYAKANGIQVVNHSVAWFNSSRGDGSGAAGTPDATVADATANGILWVNAAGNAAQQHWSGTFVDDGSGWNLFAAGDIGNSFYLPAGASMCAYLKWDSWPVTSQDYDLYLARSSDSVVVDYSSNTQDGSQPPTETACFTNNTGVSGSFFVAINKWDATAAPRFDLFVSSSDAPVQLQYQVAAGSVTEPASSPYAFAAGAVCWQGTTIEPFSSRGPTIDGRVKPDLSGPDYVSTFTYGTFSSCSGSAGFPGTSAAAPHVAGAAALVLSANPTFTVAQLESYLQANSQDLGTPGKDNTYGSGLVFLPSPPGPPTNVTGVAQDSSVLVSWVTPANSGGRTITGYTVTSSPDSKVCTTAGDLSCTVLGLTNGTQYTFTVHATNGVGNGPESDPSNAVTPVSGDWTQFNYDRTHVGYNAQETVLNSSDVSSLQVAWTGGIGSAVDSSPAIANGVVYVGATDGKLYAFAVGCASGGGTCTPLWTGATGAGINSSPAVANGVVYVASHDNKLYAFAVGCASGGGTCTPLWTGSGGGSSSPTVADGVVYVGASDGKLYAYTVGCASGGGTCTPLWTATIGSIISSSPAVADGVVYVGGDDGKLYAFAVGCASGGGTCTPLWTGATGNSIVSSPSVANGVIYVGSGDNKLYAFAVGCASGGGTCTPLWTGATGGWMYSSPVVANGVVYIGATDGKLYAFAVGCASGGGTCTPLWTATNGGANGVSSPAVANGVVYAGTWQRTVFAYAVGCSTGGGTCTPLWTANTGASLGGVPGDGIYSSVAIANGMVYVGSDDGNLYAFGLPTATLVVSSTTPYIAGVAHNLTVTARDAFAHNATGYRGRVHFTSTDPAAILPADYTFTAADNGVHTFSVTLKTAGTRSVTATDTVTASINGTQTNIVVNPGSATRLVVGPGLASPRTSGAAGSLTLTARDAYGNVATGYRGTVHFTSTDPAAALPANYTFTSGDAGIHVFGVTLKTYGSQSVTAKDIANSSITATQSGIVVVRAASTYTPINPRRVLDTRPTVASGNPTNIGLTGKFTAGTVRKFTVAGAHYVKGGTALAVPANAVAVTGNLTIVNETAAGVIDLGPAASAGGATSTLSFVKGDTRANNVTVGLAADGSLSAVYRSSTAGATTDLIFDVTGYFLPNTSGATYHTVSPGRILDTRPTGLSGATHIGPLTKLANRVVKSFPVVGVKPLGGTSVLVPSGAVAVTGNLTVTNATSAGYVALGPTMSAYPSTSTVNVPAGTNVANGVTVALSSGRLSVVWCGTVGSSADVIFDVTGYLTAGPGGLSFYAVSPTRLVDSSKNTGLAGPFASRNARLFTVAGKGGVPSDAKAIAGNLTLITPSSGGWALISPEIVASPTTSTVNAPAGRNEANGFDVALGSSGHVALEWAGTTGSTANLALDVTGYWK